MQNDYSEQIKAVLTPIKKQAELIMQYSLWSFFLLGFMLGFYYDTFIIAAGVGGLCLAAFYLSKILLPESDFYQYIGSAVFAIFTAQFIYQMHGMFEMHFFVFLTSTLLIVFQNWRLQLPLIIIVVVHHGLFAYLQYTGMKDIYFSQLDYMDLQTFLIHGGLAAVIVGICGLWAYQLNKRSFEYAENYVLLRRQMSQMDNNVSFAEEISKGNFKTDFTIDENNKLGKALSLMRENLVKAAIREDSERFINIGLNRIGEVLRKHMSDLSMLCDETLRELVTYVKANQGVFYVVEQREDEIYLELKACYAYGKKKHLTHKIYPGEGLSGQCYLEKEMILLTEVPENYVKITSGLGEAPPSFVVILPIMNDTEVVGILEIASFQALKEEVTDFLQNVSKSIGSSISAIKITERTNRLLEESHNQALQLKMRQEERDDNHMYN